MHVAQINFQCAPPGRTAAEVLEQWPSLSIIAETAAGAGVRVSVLQAATSAERVIRDAVDYHFIDCGNSGTAEQRAAHFARTAAAVNAEVLHVHGLGFAREAFALTRHLPKVPLLIQDHADRPPRWWRRPRWRRWYAAAAGVTFTAPDLGLPFTADGMFRSHTRVFAIPECSTRFTPGSRAAARAATGLHGEPCVLWVGHLSAGKDPLTVLEGVASAAERLSGLQLWCAFGSAPLFAEVQRRIAGDSRLAGRVHLLGKVPHAEVEILLRAADLFVSGSRAEGCGYAALEALACGIPPVITDIPAFRSLTGSGRVGHLWPCGDAARLAAALVNAASARPSAHQLRAHFDAELSFTAVGRQWAAAYSRLLGVPGRREG